ncbi:MAG: threonylcarbamoyl-AMP synthase [Deltaproteobacteria bacterium]|nr:threonylcarbamoyl-AMP synthase [Deltaproteobacteria bacterium]
MNILTPHEAGLVIKGIFIYPTETLYAIGANVENPQAIIRIQDLKGRPLGKPLPLVTSHEGQAREWFQLQDLSLEVAWAFWPGPLSILLRPRRHLPPGVCGPDGMACVRIPAHPLARALASSVRAPVVSTSANSSGNPAPARVEDIEPAIKDHVDYVFTDPPFPYGGPPSTIVAVVGDSLSVIREGAVSIAEIQAKGFCVMV